MSLRLVKPGLSATLPHKIHPRTGERIFPLGVGKRGPIWPVIGASGEDDDEDEDEDKDGEQGGTGGNPDDDDPVKLKARIAALEDEKNRHYKRRGEAESELVTLRKFKAEAENAGKTEAQRLQAELDTLKEQAAKHKADNDKLRIQNAFLANNDIKWHNSEQALKLADLSEVKIDADGNVDTKALKAALTNLANSNKHLVKSDDSGDGAGDQSGNKDQGSGTPMSGDRKGGKKDQGPTREDLAKKFPVLNTIR